MTTDTFTGLISFASPWPFSETVARIEAALNAKKIKVFARIDQAAEAAAAGLTLRPTTLLIFGDPGKGTPLMQTYPALAIDLPLKALVWEANPSEIFVALTSPEFLQKRYSLPFAPLTEVVGLFKALLTADSPA